MVLGSNEARSMRCRLPDGDWRVTQIDVMAQSIHQLAESVQGEFAFETPDSRAALTVFINDNADLTLPVAGAETTGEGQPPAIQALRIKTNSDDLTVAEIGSAFADDLEAEGGRAPYSWSLVAGSLPEGVSITGSELTGTPTQAGEFDYTVRVTDAKGTTAERALRLVVDRAAVEDRGP
jgi:hypothetical protein